MLPVESTKAIIDLISFARLGTAVEYTIKCAPTTNAMTFCDVL